MSNDKYRIEALFGKEIKEVNTKEGFLEEVKKSKPGDIILLKED